MFSNKFRFWKMTVLLALILALCYYGLLTGPDTVLTIEECMEDSTCNDVELIVAYYKVGTVYPDRFELLVGDGAVMVEGSPEDAIEGDYVSVRGLLKEQGYLTLEEIHVHKHEELKYVISLIPLPFVLWFFLREFEISRKCVRRR